MVQREMDVSPLSFLLVFGQTVVSVNRRKRMALDTDDSPLDVLARLVAAMNRRDLAAFVACFDSDYESDQPAHPDRRFRGREQVERNWSAMFAGLPDFRVELLRSTVEHRSVWVEWRWTGTRADGTGLDACGVCIFGVSVGRVTWGRLYMEDVVGGQTIDAAVDSFTGKRGSGKS